MREHFQFKITITWHWMEIYGKRGALLKKPRLTVNQAEYLVNAHGLDKVQAAENACVALAQKFATDDEQWAGFAGFSVFDSYQPITEIWSDHDCDMDGVVNYNMGLL